jgi:hypothetical protein
MLGIQAFLAKIEGSLADKDWDGFPGLKASPDSNSWIAASQTGTTAEK